MKLCKPIAIIPMPAAYSMPYSIEEVMKAAHRAVSMVIIDRGKYNREAKHYQPIIEKWKEGHKAMLIRCRFAPIIMARYLCFYYLTTYRGYGPSHLKHAFNCDHTTVIHGRELVRGQVTAKFDNDYKEAFEIMRSVMEEGFCRAVV